MIDPLIPTLMILGVVMTIAFFGSIIANFILGILTPAPAKRIKWASWKHQTLTFIFKSNFLCEVVACVVHPNGYLETLGKKHHRIPILRPSFKNVEEGYAEEDLTKGDFENLTQTQQQIVKENLAIAKVETEILRPSTLEGTRTPCYFVYDGVAVAMSPQAVLALSHDSQFLDGEIINEGKAFKVSTLLPVNPTNAKKYISKLIDQTSMDAAYEDGKAEGLLEGRNEKVAKLFIYGGLAMMIFGGVMLAIAAFLH